MRSPRVKRRPGNPGRLNSPARRLDKPVRDQALELCRRLWREPVWDLKIVAARILARKPVEPDARVWGFVTERMAELDGWAVAASRRAACSRTPAGSTPSKPGSKTPPRAQTLPQTQVDLTVLLIELPRSAGFPLLRDPKGRMGCGKQGWIDAGSR